MTEPDNRFSGQSLEHLTALTDGLFAVAMTLLVLDLRVPAAAASSEHGLWHAISSLGPSFAAYLLRFTCWARSGWPRTLCWELSATATGR